MADKKIYMSIDIYGKDQANDRLWYWLEGYQKHMSFSKQPVIGGENISGEAYFKKWSVDSFSAETYFKKWSENCRLFENYKPVHSHEDLLKFAEDYHKNKIKEIRKLLVDETDKRRLNELSLEKASSSLVDIEYHKARKEAFNHMVVVISNLMEDE